MFDIGWSELLLIAIVALIVIGPKELPEVLRSLGRAMNRMRRSADDFRRQFEDSVRDTGYDDIQRNLQDIRQFNPAHQVRESIDRALNSEPTAPAHTSLSPSAPEVSPQEVGHADHGNPVADAPTGQGSSSQSTAYGAQNQGAPMQGPAAIFRGGPQVAEGAANDAGLAASSTPPVSTPAPVAEHHAAALQEPAKAS
jgi:sec-independent protein translocase protein TatB